MQQLRLFHWMISLMVIWMATCQSSIRGDDKISIGSKMFTESRVLGEMLALLATDAGTSAEHTSMGGTQLLFKALQAGEIDAYVDYTGTIIKEILADQNVTDGSSLRSALAQRRIRMSEPLGFSNNYVLGMREKQAEELQIRKISDLRDHPELEIGFSNEFMNRDDGWPGLRIRYQLPHQNVTGLNHDLAYRAIETGAIDVTDLYSTDAEIEYYNLRALVDDLSYFPAYDAVILYRDDLARRAPDVAKALMRLPGRIDEQAMIDMNARAKIDKIGAVRVAADYLQSSLGLSVAVRERTYADILLKVTLEHLYLVSVSLSAAILIAIPLGILAARQPVAAHVILGGAGILQTIPSIALLVFMMPLLGAKAPPAIAALFLYSLLPIVRNTHAGLTGISPEVRESAEALGLPSAARLWKIELPLASRSILAGIKTSAVINVGTATLGGFIGAGGYGGPIFTGIQRDDINQILYEGAIPAAVMALLVQGMFEYAERFLVPKGLRLGK